MIDEKNLIEDIRKCDRYVVEVGEEKTLVDVVRLDDVKRTINKQPKTDWIPIEKELPKKHDDYFVTVKKISNGKVEYFTAIDTFEPQTNGWYMNIDIPNLKREVIAWQPKCFPKPYDRMTEREGKCAFEEQFPRGDAYICKKTALICTAEKLKYCKHKQPYKKEGAEQ